MRKDALSITIFTLVLGIFAAFFRWLQNLNAFDSIGLAVPGAGITIAFVVYMILAVAAIAALMLVWLRRFEKSPEAGAAFRCESIIPALVCWCLAAVVVLSGLVLMFSADSCRYPLMQRIFSALAILAGLSLPFIFGRKGSREPNPMGGICSVVLVAFACFWLIFSYRCHSENPVIWAFAVEILAIAATTMAFYYISAYFYGRAKPERCIFTVQLAAVLDMAALSDERAMGISLIFAACAAMMLLTEWVMICSMKENLGD